MQILLRSHGGSSWLATGRRCWFQFVFVMILCGVACPQIVDAQAADSATHLWTCGTSTAEAPSYGALLGDGDLFQIGGGLLPRAFGPKRLLVMPVDFPDLPGANTTESEVLQEMEAVNQFYQANSFQQFSVTNIVVTPLIRLSTNSARYAERDPMFLLEEARAAAENLGYATMDYDFDIVTFRHIGFPWGGLGYVNGKGAFIQSETFSRFAAAHELGHNLGSRHAGFWVAEDDSIIGPGLRLDSANDFDVMGTAGLGHFNANFKYLVGWLPNSLIHTVTNAGIYRLHAIDTPGPLRQDRRYGIRIPIGPPSNSVPADYWIDFRQQFTNNPFAMSGAILKRAADVSGPLNNQLLDMNPGSPYGARDAPLPIGHTFTDGSRGLSVTPVAKGGGDAERWLDVMVNLGGSNLHAPTLGLSASALTASPGEPIQFTATASDVDGDGLAYGWDFGDRSLPESSLNQPSVEKRWPTAGEYVVRCIASDMKGHQRSATILVRVGNPTTFHLGGYVFWRSSPLGGVRVHNGRTGWDYRDAYTDSEGRFTLVDLAPGSYSIEAVKAGFIFAYTFTNPISATAQSLQSLFIQAETNTASFIIRIVPASGAIGTSVSIRGNHLPIPDWPGRVHFGGVPSPSYSWRSFSEIVATVPEGAVTGPISLQYSWPSNGTLISAVPFVVLPRPPGILVQPQSQTNGAGFTTTLRVTPSGSGPFFYQWRKEAQDIPSATARILTITNLQFEDSAAYDVVVSNSVGSITSSVAMVQVIDLPGFDEALDIDGFVWRTGGTAGWLPRTNETFDGWDAAESGYLQESSDESWLETTVNGPGRLRFHYSRSAPIGLSVRFGVSASQLTNVTYLSGSGGWWSAEIRLPDGPQVLRWIATGTSGDVSQRARLDQVTFIPGLPPLITEQPLPKIVPAGQSVTFEVETLGTEPLAYQWFRWFNQLIPGATNRTYTISHPSPDHTGSYFVRVTNLAGEVTSDLARLSVPQPPDPQISYPLDGAEVPSGNVSLSVSSAYSEFHLRRVQIFDGAQQILDHCCSPPFQVSLTLSNVSAGRRLNLVAVVTDDHGQVGTSALARVSVVLPQIPRGANWRFLDTGVDPGPSWRQPDFDDGAWSRGRAPFGYPPGRWSSSAMLTPLNFGSDPSNKHVTTWFRHAFAVADASSLSNAMLWLRRDDGAAVHLNGTEVLRSNLPDEPITAKTLASEPITGGEETAFFPWQIPSHLFVTGTNVLAVEVHQSDAGSDDLYFDLKLTAYLPPVPVVAITSPGNLVSITNASISIRAAAAHPTGQIARVEFFADNIKIGEDTSPPFDMVWSNTPLHQQYLTLSAVATDVVGNPSSSSPVSIRIMAPEGTIPLTALEWWFLDDGSDAAAWWDAESALYTWRNGPSPMGNGPGAKTVIDLGPTGARHPTTYFYSWLNLDIDPTPRFDGVTLHLLCELTDGIIVYVNSVEAFRRNLPEGPISSSDYTGHLPGPIGWVQAPIDPGLLRANNFVAVAMVQNLPDSMQLMFDAALSCQFDPTIPPLTIILTDEGPILTWEAKWVWSEEDSRWRYWEGHLEEADAPEGPWRWADEGSNGGYFIRTDVSQRFFRVSWP